MQLTLREQGIADEQAVVYGSEVQREIVLDQAAHDPFDLERLLWSPEHPNLIYAVFTLVDAGEVTDEVHSYAGLRSVGVRDGHFLLNGHPYYLRLALEQGYWPATHLAAPDAAALAHDVELAKQLGFNGLRIHQKVEDPRFLYYCDRLGMLVWGEMANAYVFSHTAVRRLATEWMAVVARDASHPCVVAWVPINESWGVPHLVSQGQERHFVRCLYHLTKALDPTRPVLGNEGWEHVASDVLGVHDYTSEGAVLRRRYGSSAVLARTLARPERDQRLLVLDGCSAADRPFMVTEFGGISYRPATGDAWFGYSTVTSSQAYLDKYRELVDAILDSPAVAGFCYTQLTDTAQETNGLLTEDRAPKLDVAKVRAITMRDPARGPSEETRVCSNDETSSG